MEFEKLYTAEDVAQITGLTLRTIRNYIKSGRLKGHRIGVQWRFTAADIQALFDVPIEESQPSSRETVPQEENKKAAGNGKKQSLYAEEGEREWPHLSEDLNWEQSSAGKSKSESGNSAANVHGASSYAQGTAASEEEQAWMAELTASLASAVQDEEDWETQGSHSGGEKENTGEPAKDRHDIPWWSSLLGEEDEDFSQEEDLSFLKMDGELETTEETPEGEKEEAGTAQADISTKEESQTESVSQEKSVEEELAAVPPTTRQAYEYLMQGKVSHASSCAVVDIPMGTAQEAEFLYNRLMTLAGVYKDDARRLELTYEYDEEWGQARYVFSGAMESVCAMLNLCDVQ